eukprot:m.341847 g.341847  ORF g.341847 m.341847 type:complete len:346 (+) comp20577_c0_seq1:120-1157(+)
MTLLKILIGLCMVASTCGLYPKSLMYWGPNSGRVTTCMEQQEKTGFNVESRVVFKLLGVEGTGHHAFMYCLPKSLLGGIFPKEAESFPWYFDHRRDARHIPRIPQDIRNAEKFLLLVREPMDGFVSAIDRFWDLTPRAPDQVDSITNELRGELYGYRTLSLILKDIPCDKIAFVSFDKFRQYPSPHKQLMAEFLGVEESDKDLLLFLEKSDAGVKDPYAQNCTKRQKLSQSIKKYFSRKDLAPRDRWCHSNMSMALCVINIREIVYNITRTLRDFFPELVPKTALSACDKRDLWADEFAPHSLVHEFGTDVFRRTGLNHTELIEAVTQEYPQRKQGKIWVKDAYV